MKFSCPACQAKYFVRDEDVLGRTLKLRCHSCQSDIPLQGRHRSVRDQDPRAHRISSDRLRLALPLELSGARAVLGLVEAAPASSAPPSLPPPPVVDVASDQFYIGIAGRAVGPLDGAQLAERWAHGQVGPRTYVWRFGHSIWQRWADVPELVALLPAADRPAGPRPDPPEPPRPELRPLRAHQPPAQPLPRLSERTSLVVGVLVCLALGIALGSLV